MKQCVIIHGGEAFDSEEQYYAFLEAYEVDPTKPSRKKRRDWIAHALSHEWQVFLPQMPNPQHATYRAWKIWFEKLIPYLRDEGVTLIGGSLGAMFLLKYLSEETFPVAIEQLHLIAAALDTEGLTGEGMADFGRDHTCGDHIQQQAREIYLYHSKDDPLVTYRHAVRLQELLPVATLMSFETRGHFLLPAFPELLENMRVYKT